MARVHLIEKKGGQAGAFPCNVLDEEQLQTIAAEIQKRWGNINLLLNGAGGNDPRTSTDKEFLEAEERRLART